MKIAVEEFTAELAAEIGPLGQANWDECSEVKSEICSFHGERGFRIEPNIEQYQALSDMGALLAMILRDEAGVMQGYALSILYKSLHHKTIPCANVDSFYVVPEFRASVAAFIAKLEDQFKEREVVVVGWPTTADSGMFNILNALGYRPDDVIMEKRICALL